MEKGKTIFYFTLLYTDALFAVNQIEAPVGRAGKIDAKLRPAAFPLVLVRTISGFLSANKNRLFGLSILAASITVVFNGCELLFDPQKYAGALQNTDGSLLA